LISDHSGHYISFKNALHTYISKIWNNVYLVRITNENQIIWCGKWPTIVKEVATTPVSPPNILFSNGRDGARESELIRWLIVFCSQLTSQLSTVHAKNVVTFFFIFVQRIAFSIRILFHSLNGHNKIAIASSTIIHTQSCLARTVVYHVCHVHITANRIEKIQFT